MTNGNPSVTGRVLHVTGLTKSYRAAGEQVAVLRGVNLAVAAGESVALTGESGSATLSPGSMQPMVARSGWPMRRSATSAMPGARNCAATGSAWCFSNST